MYYTFEELREDPAQLFRRFAEFAYRIPDGSTLEDAVIRLNQFKSELAGCLKVAWPWISHRTEGELLLDWLARSLPDCPKTEPADWFYIRGFLCDALSLPIGFAVLGEIERPALVKNCVDIAWLLNDLAERLRKSERKPIALLDFLAGSADRPAVPVEDFLQVKYNPADPKLIWIGKPAWSLAQAGLNWSQISEKLGGLYDPETYRKWAIAYGMETGQQLQRRPKGRPSKVKSDIGNLH